MELDLGIGGHGFMAERGCVVKAAVGVINLRVAHGLVLAGVIADPAIGALLGGHGGFVEGRVSIPRVGAASREGALLRLADGLLPA